MAAAAATPAAGAIGGGRLQSVAFGGVGGSEALGGGKASSTFVFFCNENLLTNYYYNLMDKIFVKFDGCFNKAGI